jgi:DNA-binding SARP family transcriptional activator/DNA-binding XRE family transcriptional regulator
VKVAGDCKRHANCTGDKMRALRRSAGLTQRSLADSAGVSVGVIRDLEQGKTRRLRSASLQRLSRVLKVPRLNLLGPVEGLRDEADPNIHVLGSLQVWHSGELVTIGPRRQRAVLALLAVCVGKSLHRDAILDALWGDTPPSSGPAVIQSYVSRLRHVLDPQRSQRARCGLLSSDGTSYQLTISGDQLDLLAFRQLLDGARRARDAGESAVACSLYEEALTLWTDEPLADLPLLHNHPAVVRLKLERAAAVIEYADAACEAGSCERAIPHLYALTVCEPFNERAHVRLMTALAATGQQGTALQLFGEVKERLAEDLGLDVGPELAEAHLQVLRGHVMPEHSALDGRHI